MCTLLTQNICLMCHTQRLHLGGNQIGDAGLTAFAKAVEGGALPALEELHFAWNLIGDAGLQAFADAVSKWGFPKCTYINLKGNPGSSAPVEKALREREK